MFRNTTIYQKGLRIAGEVLLKVHGRDVLAEKIRDEVLKIPVNILGALNQPSEENFSFLKNAVLNICALFPLLELGGRLKAVNNAESLINKLIDFKNELERFPDNRKKILILTLRIGEGHRTAAFGTLAGIQKLYGYDYNVEVIDFVETMNMLIGKTSEKVYTKSIKYFPSFYKFFYETVDKKWRVKLLNYLNYPLLYTKLNRLLLEKNPDLIISTYPVWDYSVQQIWKKYYKKVKFVSVITDSITVHSSWITGDTDYYIVSNEDTAESLRKLKVEKEKIKVFGFPLNPVWYEAELKFREEDKKREFLKSIGLKPDLLTILYIVNTGGTRRSLQVVLKIAELCGVQMIVVTGKNKKLFDDFLGLKVDFPCHVFGWVNNMHELMQVCDIVITKAGGASVMECIFAKKPMIITKIIAGQETGNAELIKKHHLGYIVDTPEEIVEAVLKIKKYRRILEKNLEKLRYPKAAENAAKFVIRMV